MLYAVVLGQCGFLSATSSFLLFRKKEMIFIEEFFFLPSLKLGTQILNSVLYLVGLSIIKNVKLKYIKLYKEMLKCMFMNALFFCG